MFSPRSFPRGQWISVTDSCQQIIKNVALSHHMDLPQQYRNIHFGVWRLGLTELRLKK